MHLLICFHVVASGSGCRVGAGYTAGLCAGICARWRLAAGSGDQGGRLDWTEALYQCLFRALAHKALLAPLTPMQYLLPMHPRIAHNRLWWICRNAARVLV
jgi:hypothetical protein